MINTQLSNISLKHRALFEHMNTNNVGELLCPLHYHMSATRHLNENKPSVKPTEGKKMCLSLAVLFLGLPFNPWAVPLLRWLVAGFPPW
jgi:hypothetical protein